jgi:molybdate transport system permease protein
MEEIDPQLIQVARSLGAKRFDAFLTIIIPLSLRSIIAGSTLMFARSIGEFGATIMIAGNIAGLTQTIPLAIFEYAGTPGGDTIALGLCLVSITLALAVLIYNERLINHWHKERVR